MKTWVNPRLPTLLSSCGLGTSVSYAQKNLWVACTVAPAYVVLIPLLLMSPALMEDAIILPQLSLAGSDFSSLFFRPPPHPRSSKSNFPSSALSSLQPWSPSETLPDSNATSLPKDSVHQCEPPTIKHNTLSCLDPALG